MKALRVLRLSNNGFRGEEAGAGAWPREAGGAT